MPKKEVKESGLQNIKSLSKQYKKAKIYFHQDLDGVASALAIKNYLERYGIDVVDSEIIQYGDKEFTISKPDSDSDVMPVLVDFAHGKPVFKIHTDHHDSQAGADQTKATSFRSARSNAETLSQIVAPSDVFSTGDLKIISTVDSADYARYNITPEEVANFIKDIDPEYDTPRNKMLFGFVVNKLLLAYKNKPGFLEELVMTSEPSLISIYRQIIRIAKREGYATPEQMQRNHADYVKRQKEGGKVRLIDGRIIKQFGGGSMFKPGSYDRYTPFKVHPNADFLVLAWGMGLVQASCNPFKKERALKGVDLGAIGRQIIDDLREWGNDKLIPLSTIKHISEGFKVGKSENPIGFTLTDLKALYGEDNTQNLTPEKINQLDVIMSKPSTELTEEEWQVLDGVTVPLTRLIERNSGGHRCITNLGALNYFKRSTRPGDRNDKPFMKLIFRVQDRFVDILRQKIRESEQKLNESKMTLKVTSGQMKKIVSEVKKEKGR